MSQTRQPFPYDLAGPIGSRATLGLVVLQVDETLEQDFRQMFPSDDVAIYVSRIPSGDDLTPDTIATMETTMTAAASLLPTAAPFDVVGYGCTSGTTLIGQARVAELLRAGVRTPEVSDPLTATLAALGALNITGLGLVTHMSTVSANRCDGPLRGPVLTCAQAFRSERRSRREWRVLIRLRPMPRRLRLGNKAMSRRCFSPARTFAP